MKKIQNHFISGILIVAPLALSIYVAWVVVGIADKIFRPFIPLNKFGIPSETVSYTHLTLPTIQYV